MTDRFGRHIGLRFLQASTSYVPWAELLLHCFLIDVLACPGGCPGRLVPVAVIRQQHIVDRILRHLGLPLQPAQLASEETLAYDVSDDVMPEWIEGVDAAARSPPCDPCIHPPAPDE